MPGNPLTPARRQARRDRQRERRNPPEPLWITLDELVRRGWLLVIRDDAGHEGYFPSQLYWTSKEP